ncbi:MAG: hypothetical protein BWZ03_00237 [bacterium ADurb.BinA186]|nr:MAG: hypothetical protein BWZ03_00237 [bacterium ADurb.BinA186]
MGSAISTVTSAVGLGSAVDGVGEAVTGRRAKERANDAARNATDAANSASERGWARQQDEMEPWKQAGLKALTGLQDGSFFQQDPGYQFRLDEGNKAINAAMAARGNAGGGAALKELTRYGQGFASNEYQNAWNRTNQLANYGNNASMALGNFAGGHATNLANNAIGYGNAQAASEIAQGNRNAQMLSSFLSSGAKAAGAKMGGG